MLLFCLLLEEIQILYNIINVVKYPLGRELDSNIFICAIYPMILINVHCSESPLKVLRMKKRIQEEEKGGDGLLER